MRSASDIDNLPDLNYVLAEDPPHELTIHSFPRDPRYRLSGSIPTPQAGDIARCGYRKKGPGDPSLLGHPITCSRCLTLKGLA